MGDGKAPSKKGGLERISNLLILAYRVGEMATILTVIATVIAALYGVAVLITLIELWRAPHGYEDENGFHVIDQPRRKRRASDHPTSAGLPA